MFLEAKGSGQCFLGLAALHSVRFKFHNSQQAQAKVQEQKQFLRQVFSVHVEL
jgi:hypothetical protein